MPSYLLSSPCCILCTFCSWPIRFLRCASQHQAQHRSGCGLTQAKQQDRQPLIPTGPAAPTQPSTTFAFSSQYSTVDSAPFPFHEHSLIISEELQPNHVPNLSRITPPWKLRVPADPKSSPWHTIAPGLPSLWMVSPRPGVGGWLLRAAHEMWQCKLTGPQDMSSAALHEAQRTAARGNEVGVTGFVLDKTILGLLFISSLSPSCPQIIYLLLSRLMCNSSALLSNRLSVFPVFQALPSVSKDSSYHSWDGPGLNSPEVCYRADTSHQKTSHLPTHSLACLFQPETAVLTTSYSMSTAFSGQGKEQ